MPFDPQTYGTTEEAAMLTGTGGGDIPQAPAMFDPMKQRSQLDLYKLMLSQAPYGQKERQLARQAQLAEELRATPAPGMRGVGGRVQTAANPLEFLGAGLNKYQGIMDRSRVEGQQDKLFQDRLDALTRAGGG